ncbi:MAG: hypothetical protein HC913_17545 [Microscillaceae bacterium]|nr:hypothetical protein [Microscillaceae bacterium]
MKPSKPISRRKVNGSQIVWMAALFLLLFNYPLLSIFNKPTYVQEIPLLYVYVFGLWLGIIAVLWGMSRLPKGRLK